MSINGRATVQLDCTCDNCDQELDEGDRTYCWACYDEIKDYVKDLEKCLEKANEKIVELEFKVAK